MSSGNFVEIQCGEPFLRPSLAEACGASQFLAFMTIVDTFIRAKQDISGLCERVHNVNPPASEYDFIVVGGGSAGAVVASRLSEVPEWNVLLLEAGPDEPPGAEVPSMVASFLGSKIDWNHTTTGEKNACLSNNGSCRWPRGKNLGGCSVHHGMMYSRGNPKDYDGWAALGNEGWSWDEVLPFFLKSENNSEISRVGSKYHGSSGLFPVERFPHQPQMAWEILKAGAEKGYPISEDLNGEQRAGFSVAQTNSKNGVRVSSAAAFLRPFRNRKNLHIALNATVTKILIKDKTAVGVKFIQDGQQHTVKASKEVVVSGGAVNSPQLLLLSGIGPKKDLQAVNVPHVVKDLPGVGQNLQNHVSYTVSWSTNQPNVNDLDWPALVTYLGFQQGPMSSTGLSQVTALLPSSLTTKDDPDIQMFFGGYTAGCSATGDIGAVKGSGFRRVSASPTNIKPLSRGTLKLASNNPLDKPVIWGNYLSNARDSAILVEGIQIALSLANTSALAKYNLTLLNQPLPACSEHAFLTDAYWTCAIRQNTDPENHQAGSCKMGPRSDPLAVVNNRLQVHGIKNLRVADTSIMPKVISGNTAAPATMIAERAADFIKEDWDAAETQRFPCEPYCLLDEIFRKLRRFVLRLGSWLF
ncbi:glucose dehydrogenase [FAD, quinone] [Cephus cinctus]|uniref:Glucose dehydrogenase [FAD, quinone] n=1 Tax=Cephus cinctus TaxID=211228 RepID=A0AAJ7VWL1_CEPCN|nr:glucose dehydrogenase [FAD, quinone] [Cephus cinctus]